LRPGDSRVIGDTLSVASVQYLTDTPSPSVPSNDVRLTTVDVDGSIHSGTAVPIVEPCCWHWTVSVDGRAVGALPDDLSTVMAIGPEGADPGWPLQIEGIASPPSFTV